MHLHKNGSTTFIFSTILIYFYHFQPFLLFKKCAYLKEVIRRDFDQCVRLLRLKLQPREVAEVARVQSKKNRSKILKSAIFELQKRYIPQKKAENNRHSDLK